MKTVVFLGSRNPSGQTARAAEALRAGLEAHAFTAESVFLPTLRIERCRQCDDNGWGLCRRAGRCVIEDDFADLVGRLRAADIAIFATPVYYSDLSESLRALLDRLRRTCTHPEGRKGIEGKPAAGLCVAGGGGGGAPACCASLDKILTTCGFLVADTIPVRRQNLESKLPILTRIGSALAAP